MKLKNSALAGLMVLACMASCSKDAQTPILDLPDARLSINIKAAAIGTKASDSDALKGEANINNVAVVVFNESGSALLGAPVWEEVSTESGSAGILNVPAKATIAKIVIVANTPKGVFNTVTSYTDMQSRLAELSAQSQTNLTMSSQVITSTTALSKNDNYLGYESMGAANINGISSPLEITRLAARLELLRFDTRFVSSKLSGRSVRVDEIYIANEKTVSHYFSEGYWGAVVTAGHLGNGAVFAVGKDIADNTPLAGTLYQKYVMENDALEKPTQLIVKATLLESATNGAETKLFAATINADGIKKGYDHNYVKRNYIYRLTVTFTGNSFDGDHPLTPVEPPEPPVTPTEDLLDVQVTVVGWGPVSQDVVIE